MNKNKFIYATAACLLTLTSVSSHADMTTSKNSCKGNGCKTNGDKSSQSNGCSSKNGKHSCKSHGCKTKKDKNSCKSHGCNAKSSLTKTQDK